jgi:PmbA protein
MTQKFPDPAAADRLDRLVKAALKAGADAADAVEFKNVSVGVSYRLGKLEDVGRSESSDLGLRVFVGKQVAFVSSTDFSKVGPGRAPRTRRRHGAAGAGGQIRRAGAQRTAGARFSRSRHRRSRGTLDRASGRTGQGRGSRSLGSARRHQFGRRQRRLRPHHGDAARPARAFSAGYTGTSCSVSASVIAGDGTEMERDYDYAHTRFGADLQSPEAVGRSAGERAVKRLNPRKVKTQSVPVFYDPRVSPSLVGHFAGAISGAAIARGVSFLKDRMGQEVFAEGVSIIDDPHRRRGVRSKPFDGEGVANRMTVLIDKGRLTTWLLDSASARQLGLETTGHAARGTGGPPSPSATNLYMGRVRCRPAN